MNILKPHVSLNVTNIDAFGHRFEPIIDLDAPDARLSPSTRRSSASPRPSAGRGTRSSISPSPT